MGLPVLMGLRVSSIGPEKFHMVSNYKFDFDLLTIQEGGFGVVWNSWSLNRLWTEYRCGLLRAPQCQKSLASEPNISINYGALN